MDRRPAPADHRAPRNEAPSVDIDVTVLLPVAAGLGLPLVTVDLA